MSAAEMTVEMVNMMTIMMVLIMILLRITTVLMSIRDGHSDSFGHSDNKIFTQIRLYSKCSDYVRICSTVYLGFKKNQNPNAHLYSNDNAILTNINDQYDDDRDDIRILLLDGSQGLLLSTPLRLSDIDNERFTNGTSKAIFFSTQNVINEIG